MSEPLKIGDRVRIHGLENDGDIYSTNVGTYIECPELDGMTGTIIEVNKNGYIVREDSGREEDFIGACLTLLERPRRTFEEIVVALADNPLFLSYNCDIAEGDINRESAHFEHYKSKRMFTLLSCGHFWTETQFVDLSPAQLAAISAACAEIAENWEAEHGKENKQ